MQRCETCIDNSKSVLVISKTLFIKCLSWTFNLRFSHACHFWLQTWWWQLNAKKRLLSVLEPWRWHWCSQNHLLYTVYMTWGSSAGKFCSLKTKIWCWIPNRKDALFAQISTCNTEISVWYISVYLKKWIIGGRNINIHWFPE